MKLDKYHLSLAGEDRVCAELLKRGVFATITFGSMKSADVYAVGSNRRAAVIEVKASQTGRFVTVSTKRIGPSRTRRIFGCCTPYVAQLQETRNGYSYSHMRKWVPLRLK
jgi:hypothetical protein